ARESANGARLGRRWRGRDSHHYFGTGLSTARPVPFKARRIYPGTELDLPCGSCAGARLVNDGLSKTGGKYVLRRGAQQFSDAPGLRAAATRPVRRVAVGDLRDLPQGHRVRMVAKSGEQFARSQASLLLAPVDLYVRRDERPHQPWPDRALVIR